MTLKQRLHNAESTISSKKAKAAHGMSEEEIFFIRSVNRGLELFNKPDRTAEDTAEMQKIELEIGATMATIHQITESFLNDY